MAQTGTSVIRRQSFGVPAAGAGPQRASQLHERCLLAAACNERCWALEHMLSLRAPGAAERDSSGTYNFVFLPSHLFPTFQSYRWWAVTMDR